MQQTTYTNRQIWHIAYPILISLIMEQHDGHRLPGPRG